VSPSYWGPSQIFGTLDPNAESEFENRPFLCEIPDDDIGCIRDIHSGVISDAPESLKSSIKWFHYHPIGGTDSFLLNGAYNTMTQLSRQ